MSKGNNGGRPAIPTALHKIRGTKPRKARKREPKPLGDLDEAPDWLTDSQRASWEYAIAQAPPGLLKKLDRGLLLIWVEAEDRLRQVMLAQVELNKRGRQLPFLIRTPLGLAPSPYVDIIDKATKNMFRAAVELGFSPAARPRIQVDATAARIPDQKPSPWSTTLKLLPGGRDT